MPLRLTRSASLVLVTRKIPSRLARRIDYSYSSSHRDFTQRIDTRSWKTFDPRTYQDVVGEESVHKYRVGRFHPVVLDDIFHDGQYKVLHKLGYGSYSTVWLARDRALQRYVALKICAADYGDADRELSILNAIANLPKDDPGYRYIHSVMNSFEHQGPNGTHRCFVLEPLGPSLGKISYDHSRMLQGNMKMVKRFAKQVLLALAFLHKNGIVHADLHTGNVAMEVPSINDLPPEELIEKLGRLIPVRLVYTDNVPVPITDIHVPQFMYESVDAMSWENNFEDVECMKLVDFGNAFFLTAPPDKVSMPVELRPPEVIIGDTLSEKIDIWSAGCFLFECAAGSSPYDYFCTSNEYVLRQITGDLGPIPERWIHKWAEIIGINPRRLQVSGRSSYIHSTEDCADLKDIFERHCDGQQYDYPEAEVTGLLRNVQKMMQVDPMRRPSVTEILEDPFWIDA